MRSVWKLIVKCVCVMMPFIVLGCQVGQNLMAFAEDAPYYIWNKETANTTQEKKYRVVVLGDSTSNAAYVPEALSKDTINLALGGTTPADNYYTLREWLEHNPTPDACYISFADYHLQSSDFFWTRTMYLHRYGLRDNLEMLLTAVACKEPSILTEHYWLDFISYQLYLPNKYITSFMNASFNQRYEANIKAKELDELHGGRYMKRGTAEYTEKKRFTIDDFHVNPFFEDYYKRLIDLCIENGITPRIVKLPLSDNNEFTDKYIEEIHGYYDGLKKEYPSLTVDWFAKVYPENCFVDTMHMNSHGALQFSMELKELYPQDFSASEMDEGQIAAIDDSIRDENKIEWILKWISRKDYVVLFYDKRGKFKDMYDNRLMEKWGGIDGSALIGVPIEGIWDDEKGTQSAGCKDGSITSEKAGEARKKPEVWEFFGEGMQPAPASVSMTESGLSLQLDGQESMAWETASDDVLGVAVVNNYSHTLVCMKSFLYVDEEFRLIG